MQICMRKLSSALVFSMLAASARADAQTFFGQDLNWVLNGSPLAGSNSLAARNNFLSNLSGVGTENFDGFSVGSGAPLGLNFAGAGTATLTNNGAVSNVTASGRKATSGSKFWQLSTGSSGSQFNIKFSSAIAAFGMYGVDVGDFGDQLTMSFFNNNVAGGTWSPVHGLGGEGRGANDGNLNFFGYINTVNLFDEIRFSSVNAIPNGSADFWGFDDMTIGSRQQVSTVPEPSSVALFATGLIGLVAVGCRRKKVTQS